jgi:glutamyl/glutaminyl-tRNA synthetase
MNKTKHTKQYLNGLTPLYSGKLQKMAEQGLVYVCECREEGCDPLPEGFATLEEACVRAEELNDLPLDAGDEGQWFADHPVYRLEQDEDGAWFATFERLN